MQGERVENILDDATVSIVEHQLRQRVRQVAPVHRDRAEIFGHWILMCAQDRGDLHGRRPAPPANGEEYDVPVGIFVGVCLRMGAPFPPPLPAVMSIPAFAFDDEIDASRWIADVESHEDVGLDAPDAGDRGQ
ncbi:hypothetical protein [Methylobacterium sp. Leaf85]|uniref:hypothetical protein n=1 Tax=Methylobacterium sp. Leaf85 TaxID=1736241 RepID=UPI0012E94EC7|nr:hypothetical protein [Methylobacterium sp. Leaf85]